MSYWRTKDGKEIEYSKLEDSHLINILKYIKRKAKEGLIIEYGSYGIEGQDMFYDQDIMYGQKVLDYFDYYGLLEEARSRKLV